MRFASGCFFALICTLAGQPALAQDRSDIFGLYTTGNMSCDKAEAGKPGGAVILEQSGMKIAGIACSFSGLTNVSRMNAVIVDASCDFSGKPKRDRIFIQGNRQGVTLVAEGLGTFILTHCPQ